MRRASDSLSAIGFLHQDVLAGRGRRAHVLQVG